MRRRLLCIMLALMLCLPYAVANAESGAATKTSQDFSDLKDLDAATKAKFDALISAGVFDGVSDTSFGLKEEMNRAQFAKVAALIFGLEVNNDLQTSSFSDVNSDDPANGYALPYIEAVKTAGITDGYGEGTYNPAGKVTKEQLATFLVRGLGQREEAEETPGVNDDTVSDWAKGYVALALDQKLLTNGDDGKFGGQANATRDLLVTGAYEAKEQFVEIKQNEEKEKEEAAAKEAAEKAALEAQQRAAEEAAARAAAAQRNKPTASPAGGEVAAGTTVTLSTAANSAEIRYTTDGSTPTKSSALYSTAIPVSVDMTIKAIAYSGSSASNVMSESYTVTQPAAAETPTASIAGGEVIVGTKVALSSATVTASVYYTTDGSTPTISSTLYTEEISIDSDMTIKAIAVKDGMANSDIMSESYTVIEKVATPYASIGSGEVAMGTLVTLSTDTPDAEIRYTIDGSDPSESGTDMLTFVYHEGGFSIGGPVTYKVIAVKDGMAVSDTLILMFTIPDELRIDDFRYEDGKFIVQFNKAVSEATAETSGNYSLNTMEDGSGLAPASITATLLSSGTEVELDAGDWYATLSEGDTIYLTVTNVQSTGGQPITGNTEELMKVPDSGGGYIPPDIPDIPVIP
ncbi:chitobiase/beta-hexosaminidase C-terminal domain-containing protein [Paenibacillus sp. HB172176]|uniref:chitobiase/beta-hexosaminidase C-terminal domain-containing protein n=1 Tax=Paenibacillus sp. HB172176 TaxID=2493690 RepID=UPI00143B10AA|nr:chitobiase/beta-hexosaminidase C-terminal domain-containing protein [Paenibacillus sp. HB172176]